MKQRERNPIYIQFQKFHRRQIGNWRNQRNHLQMQLASAGILFALGLGLSVWAQGQPVSWLLFETEPAASFTQPASEPENSEAEKMEPAPSELPPEEKAQAAQVPEKTQAVADPDAIQRDEELLAATRLHMAYRFPEGAFDPSDSYAGQAFQQLTQKDSAWISGIYGLSKTSPQNLAARIGKSGSIWPEEWCKISVSFYDGDGAPISGYSNVKEILSLASVYSHYMGIENWDGFYSYAEALWKASHQYWVSMSDIYYCDGPCQFSTEKEAEFGDEELTPSSLELLDGDETDAADAEGETEGETAPIGPGAPKMAGTENEEAAEAEDGVEIAILPETAALEAVTSDTAASETVTAETAETEAVTSESETGAVSDATDSSASDAYDQAVQAFLESLTAAPDEILTAEEQEEILKASGPAGYTAYLESKAEEMAQAAGFYPAMETESEGTPTEGQAQGPGQKIEGDCKGHVDLHVTATIVGIDENSTNLFYIDPLRPDALSVDSTEDSGPDTDSVVWNGWTWIPRLYAKNLERQDWFDCYDLTVSTSMYILNPLTSSEINYYMGLLPAETSIQRQQVIQQALLSVGSIPYYWGGKPSAAGFEGNGFGTMIQPDQKGRNLRGLDCSGWISWVYWTALGNRLPTEGTYGLSTYGTSIGRSDLKPGDLIIRTGSSSHVYLFLAWASDNSMYVIHETGGVTNNVTISQTNVDWPYYRRILE